jgi:ABC-type transport system involved in cytochrome c biogenesis ATPase subunit
MHVIEAEQLSYGHGTAPLLKDLSFSIGPGLTLVRGGEGRGKSTLLRLLAGTAVASTGRLCRVARTTFLENPADPAHDALAASAWLESLRAHLPAWDAPAAHSAAQEFDLKEHIDKPMFMLSTGSRRKVGLVGAVASGAELTLIDTPFAALDAASCRCLIQLLTQAAASTRRAWVVADYELPVGLAGVPLAGLIDLGD